MVVVVWGTREEKGGYLVTMINWSFCPNQKGQRVIQESKWVNV